MNIQKKDIVCPHCGAKNTWKKENAFRPFCSERCKLIDLGDWASEQHRIPGEPVLPEDKSDSEEPNS
jgi:endogenous inhibitor of DNA gyrase (YacG/DUF329 family)